MKVLMINSVCGILSTGRICTDIAKILISQGHEVKIAYGRGEVPIEYKDIAVKIGTNFDIKTHALLSRVFDTAGFHSKKATKDFIKWVKEYDPDVIHLHNLHGYYINLPILFDYLKTSNKKIFISLHDCWTFTGHCSHFDNAGCQKWQNGCYKCALKKAYPKSLIFDNSKSNYLKKKELFSNLKNVTFIVMSKWLENEVKKSFLKDYSLKVIPNGIDLSIFKPTPSTIRQDYNLNYKTVVLGVASSWNKDKGLYDFYKLSQKLGDKYKVVLVGLTKQQLGELPSTVLGFEKTNNLVELAEFYSMADVFVNLTYNDTFPTVNMESQACGTPVITYKTGGSPDNVLSVGVVEKGNIDAVIELITSGEYKKSIIDTKNFDKQVNYLKYVETYKGE
ncbi:MAG: glycosyltransferase [Clostridia bacterium]|nr:glycosyltransferase [Clostridia bacterium]